MLPPPTVPSARTTLTPLVPPQQTTVPPDELERVLRPQTNVVNETNVVGVTVTLGTTEITLVNPRGVGGVRGVGLGRGRREEVTGIGRGAGEGMKMTIVRGRTVLLGMVEDVVMGMMIVVLREGMIGTFFNINPSLQLSKDAKVLTLPPRLVCV